MRNTKAQSTTQQTAARCYRSARQAGRGAQTRDAESTKTRPVAELRIEREIKTFIRTSKYALRILIWTALTVG